MSGAAPAPPHGISTDLPVLLDAGGYQLQPRDAAFVGVSLDSVRAVAGRADPLGFPSSEEWPACLAELRAALQSDGLLDADVRLKGTAADFFSRNPGKPFPRSDADCHTQAEANGSDGSVAEARWDDSPYAATMIQARSAAPRFHQPPMAPQSRCHPADEIRRRTRDTAVLGTHPGTAVPVRCHDTAVSGPTPAGVIASAGTAVVGPASSIRPHLRRRSRHGVHTYTLMWPCSH